MPDVFPALSFVVLLVFGIFALILVQRLQRESERQRIADEVGHDAIAVRTAPKSGGYMALFNEFLVYRANGFAAASRIPYKAVTRLGVNEFRHLPQAQAAICVEYRDGKGVDHLAQLVCVDPDGFVPKLREKIDGVAAHG